MSRVFVHKKALFLLHFSRGDVPRTGGGAYYAHFPLSCDTRRSPVSHTVEDDESYSMRMIVEPYFEIESAGRRPHATRALPYESRESREDDELSRYARATEAPLDRAKRLVP